MAGPVIADAGPLIALSAVGQLELLRKLFQQVVVPVEVVDESLYQNRLGATLIREALDCGWLHTSDGLPEHRLWSAPPSLGKGEVAAIHLALGHPDSLLILDDRLARREALRLSLSIIGTVKVVVIAQQRELIGDAERVVQQMSDNGYRVSLELLNRVKQDY
ncbi:MAG: DUF3368 domain-containing protein [Gammaproteobacteria bacterium]|nr:DUF3368 domain-containing protein [Gammaproteobacteria bacterium]MBT5361432.1 DUF3368 domain-containing protein [Gammaproteobacteria bacterium]MBT5746379.1 DUF3368 domain-containing protein [Gammaproteobacteria bacterium]MBT6670800.1 DUF3368 domain-containing protein [Gammaproteobacteria bacterium]MBT8008186.1 DUF3368 domain-containing protein [Gammaproteobacteria bacterium]